MDLTHACHEEFFTVRPQAASRKARPQNRRLRFTVCSLAAAFSGVFTLSGCAVGPGLISPSAACAQRSGGCAGQSELFAYGNGHDEKSYLWCGTAQGFDTGADGLPWVWLVATAGPPHAILHVPAASLINGCTLSGRRDAALEQTRR